MDDKQSEIAEVSIVECPGYDLERVEEAVKQAFDLIDFKPKPKSKVLLKPNVVGVYDRDQEAITTHLSIIEAVCKFLQKYDCEIIIGDSSFINTGIFMKQLGIEDLANKYGRLSVFDKEELITVKDEKAAFLKEFQIPKLIREVDLIINLPKMKTHVQSLYSGAIKNMYGCVPGGMKQVFHNTARGYENFSKLIVDLYQNLIPNMNLMDAIIGMGGPGATAGYPKKAGLILASKNAVAMDIAATKIMGIDTKEVFSIKEAINRKLYPKLDFKLKGMEKLPLIKFKKPRSDERFQGLGREFPERDVYVEENKCTKCGICALRCPVKAIKLDPFPKIDYEKCIRCFCCAEVCPQHAMFVIR